MPPQAETIEDLFPVSHFSRALVRTVHAFPQYMHRMILPKPGAEELRNQYMDFTYPPVYEFQP
jgi:hypothetical protein